MDREQISSHRVQISSKTRVGLYEEIDRFIKEKRPMSAHPIDSDPRGTWFWDGEWHILLDYKMK